MRFRSVAAGVWGQESISRLDIGFVRDPEVEARFSKAGVYAAIRYRHDPPPWASGRHLVRAAPDRIYRLLVMDEMLGLDDDSVEKILIHEAVHIGYAKHSREFLSVVRECGGAVSGSAVDRGNDNITVERKDPGERRYKPVREFTDAREAEQWARAEISSGRFPGSKWRMSQ